MVLCHGDFLNIDHEYIHENKSVKGFGSYGDVMIRDRKMYVVPTPFMLVNGTIGTKTLIVPEDFSADARFSKVGDLVRTEAAELVVGYHFDLRTNQLTVEKRPNLTVGTSHSFSAYRLNNQSGKKVSMVQISGANVFDFSEDTEEE